MFWQEIWTEKANSSYQREKRETSSLSLKKQTNANCNAR